MLFCRISSPHIRMLAMAKVVGKFQGTTKFLPAG